MPDTAELAKPVAHEKYERLIKAAKARPDERLQLRDRAQLFGFYALP